MFVWSCILRTSAEGHNFFDKAIESCLGKLKPAVKTLTSMHGRTWSMKVWKSTHVWERPIVYKDSLRPSIETPNTSIQLNLPASDSLKGSN